MTRINLDEIDEAVSSGHLKLLPEDDNILSFFLSSEVDGTNLAKRSVMSNESTGNGRNSTGNQRQQVSTNSNKRSIETASNASSEVDGPESPTGGDNDIGTEDDRRRKRLERNRESARQSRRRKKQYLELLEGKVTQLTEEIEAARAEHLDAADTTLQSLKNQLISSLYEKLAPFPVHSPLTPGLDDELRGAVHVLQEHFGPHAEERRSVVNHHFQQLDSLLLPPYTRFLLWMSIQDESFYVKANPTTPSGKKSNENDRKDSVAKKDGLWAALSTEMGLTYEQEEKIKGYYRASDSKTAKLERRKIAMAVTYLNQLKQNMSERSEAVQSYANSIHSILTPEQSIRYQQWTMLNRSKHSDGLKERGLGFTSPSSIDPHGKISTILHKKDQDLTVEDVTSLLATLSKPNA